MNQYHIGSYGYRVADTRHAKTPALMSGRLNRDGKNPTCGVGLAMRYQSDTDIFPGLVRALRGVPLASTATVALNDKYQQIPVSG